MQPKILKNAENFPTDNFKKIIKQKTKTQKNPTTNDKNGKNSVNSK